MIQPSKGRDDLEYCYHVTIETDALMTDMDREKYDSKGDDGYTADPDFSSTHPALDWFRVETVSHPPWRFTNPSSNNLGRSSSKVDISTTTGRSFGQALYCVGRLFMWRTWPVGSQEWMKS